MSDDDNLIPVDFTAKPEKDATSTLVLHRQQRTAYGGRATMGGLVVACGHPHLQMDEDTLDLECVDCKEQLDCRLFVLDWARRIRSLHWTREEVSRLNDEASRLKNEIRNLKAQLRRAQKAAT